MSEGLYVLVNFVVIFLDLILVAFFARAILSWFIMGDGENKIYLFLYYATEPFIMPVRALCNRFGWFQGIPIDIPFMISSLCIALLSFILAGPQG